mgnify:FL=1
MPAPAKRLQQLPPYFFAVLGQRIQELLAQGKDIINLDVGSPDMPPPPAVIEALTESARKPNHHGYTGYRGTSSFRQAVARYYQRRFGVDLDPEREVLPVIGTKEGIVNLALAYLDKGDVVLVPDVGYPSYAMSARLAGAEIYWMRVSEHPQYLFDVDLIPKAAARRAKLLWVNYPNNPTGAVATLEYYARLLEFCLEHDILLVSDNPYVEVTYDGYRGISLLQAARAKNYAIEFMSLSKTYNMGGWRLGAAVGNADALRTLLQVKSNVDSGHFRAVYDAASVALDTTSNDWLAARNAVYARRRDQILEALPSIGLRADKPLGAIYIWAQVADGDGARYVDEALHRAGVALAPGEAYGPGGKHFVRISLSVADHRLAEAIARLQRWRQVG